MFAFGRDGSVVGRLPAVAHADLIQSIYAALADGVAGAELSAEVLDPQFELHEFQTGPDRKIYWGREGYVDWVRQGYDVFADATFEPADLIEAGDVVLVTVEVRAIGRTSGAAVTMVVHHVWELRDGRPWRVSGYLDLAEARRAAGLD
jgi:ketosteroid isomerase-like protein